MTTKMVIQMDGLHGEIGCELRSQDGGNEVVERAEILRVEEGTLLEEIEAARGDSNDALRHTGVDEELGRALGQALVASMSEVTGTEDRRRTSNQAA
jgi:hypothetical protein